MSNDLEEQDVALSSDHELDTSEEEEEDDEEEFRKVRQGFIVDDDEDEEQEEGGEDGDGISRKHKHKRKKKHSSTDAARDAPEDLDEDDLDLLLENTGTSYKQSSRKFKRLKRVDQDPAASRSRLDDIFSDEEAGLDEEADEGSGADGAASRARTLANEFDDFIEEDEFSDDERRRQEEEDIRPHSQPRGPKGLSSQVTGIDEEKLGEIYEIFGDGEEYDWALEGEEEEGEYSDREDRETGVPELKDVFEPGELQQRFLTDQDNAIRTKDEPERFQILRSNVRTEYELSDPEFFAEQVWVADKLASEMAHMFDGRPHLRAPFARAVKKVVEFVARDSLEVPFIWQHRKDYLLWTQPADPKKDAAPGSLASAPGVNVSGPSAPIQLLYRDDLWRIVALDIEYHGVVAKSRSIDKVYKALEVEDPMIDELFPTATSLVDYQDILDYIQFRYSDIMRDREIDSGITSDTKRHSRFGMFERIRSGKIYGLVNAVAISARYLGENITARQRLHFSEDPPSYPQIYAEQYCDEAYLDTAQALDAAQVMMAEEIFYNAEIRRDIRDMFKESAKIDILLTDKGRKKIDEASPYIDFKYACNRTFEELRLRPELYLRMLLAESEGLVEVRVSYPNYKLDLFERIFTSYYVSDNVSDIAAAWNEIRRAILKRGFKKLVPLVCRNIKEDLRIDCQRSLYYDVRRTFENKLNQAPYPPYGYDPGSKSRVLALSIGMGEFGKDAVLAVVLDEDGHLVENAKLGDPRDDSFKKELVELVKRSTPDVMGLAGFTVSSHRLWGIIRGIIATEELKSDAENPDLLELLWIQDDVARVYQNSSRAVQEFPDIAPLARYCIALARYLQSPLLEYAALGKDIAAIPIHKYQYLLPSDMFDEAIESAFVDIVNVVGVEINEAVRDQQIANLVPFVAGLGPRKATGILQSIQSRGGSLSNRAELITEQITSKNIFMNCASFLRIPYDDRSVKSEDTEMLDATRIHPEDYELGRKMAADALELDEEDLAAYDSSGGVIAQLISEDPEKLNELILEEYADELESKFNQKKRETLEMIKLELQHHYGELRSPLRLLSEMDIFTMLTGETSETLHNGIVVPVSIRRVGDRFTTARLSCGVEGNIGSGNMGNVPLQFGQTIQAVVLDIQYANFTAELSASASAIKTALSASKSRPKDWTKWNHAAEEADLSRVAIKREAEQRSGRIIKHPLFKRFNSKQAEEYLAPLQRGDVVIRPSSRGYDHIAVTWKVAEQIFQHLDVLELDKDNEYTIGRTLQVGNAKYSDLDELLVMHVQAMARKVDEMIASDKFQKGSRRDVEKWLTAYTEANPKRSAYAFCFDHKNPGYFLLCFKTNAKAPVEVWHVRVIPNGYRLMRNDYPDVVSLCSGFKTIFASKMMNRMPGM